MNTKQTEALKLALERIAQLEAELMRMQGRELKLQFALAEQPAQQQDGPINEGWQITVAHGHSGYGVYAHMEDYPEEGAVLVQAIEQPAQQQEPVYFCDYGYEGWGKVDAAMAAANLADGMTVEAYYTSPPASKPWVGLTGEEKTEGCRTLGVGAYRTLAAAFEAGVEFADAKLREKNA